MKAIRPHHLLCIEFFVGKGYSEEYVSNLYQVISNLKEEDLFKITFQSDDICKKCPHLMKGTCRFEEKVLRYDAKVTKFLHLEEKEYSYAILKKQIESKIINKDQRRNICEDCEWSSLCIKKENL